MAIKMDKLKMFVGSLRDAARTSVVVIGIRLGLYRALRDGAIELTRVGRKGEDLTRFLWQRSSPKTSGNYAKGWQKRSQPFALSRRLTAATALWCLLYTPSRADSDHLPNYEERVAQELLLLGKRGGAIARAREQVLEILQSGNPCSAWFKEADSDPADVFRSVRFELEVGGTSYVYSVRDSVHGQLFKHPWAARTAQNAGRNAVVHLNANGPFFNRTSRIMQLAPGGVFGLPAGDLTLTISDYNGDTPQAQITILLHELGHIIGRLPEDDDSWDGRSFRNTSEVVRHCKTEVRAATRK